MKTDVMQKSRSPSIGRAKAKGWRDTWRRCVQCRELYLFLLPAILLIFIFNYIPMYGILMAFQDFSPALGVSGSPFVGLEHFERMFKLPTFGSLIWNTVSLSLLSLAVNFPLPIILALLLNQIRSPRGMKHLSKKRILACLMAALLTGSVLSGCGEKEPQSGDITEDGKVVLKAMFNVANTMTMEFDEMPVIQQIEEETGVDVQWEIVRTGWEDQKQLVLAGGDLPDMFFGDRTLGSSDIIANKALFTDLSEYLDQMPNVSAMFEEEPAMKNYVTTEEGSVYFLPSRMPLRPKTLTCVFINQTWLDNLGLSMPTTTEELKAVLTAFKNEDPNGNGVQDEIPATMSGGGYDTNLPGYILGCFGINYNEFSTNGERLMVKDGNIHFVPVMEEYKEAVKYMTELFSEGLLDNECFTQDGSQYMAKMASTDPQVVGMSAAWTIGAGVGTENIQDYTIIPPVKGPSGTQTYSANNFAIASISCCWVLSDSCTNKELAIKFVNAMYDPEMSAQLYFGSFGRSLEKQEDGRIKVLESPDPTKDFDTYTWENGLGNMGPYYISKEYEKNIIPNTWVTEKLDYDKVYEPYIPAPEDVYPVVVYTPEESSELSVLLTDINNIVSQKFSQWVSGEADIDAEWDSYVQSLEDVGLSRMMEIYNKYWEASSKSNS